MDDLAWDLGNPDDNQVANDNPFNPVVPVGHPGDTLPHLFHPMKGPMTTQSLRGLVFQGPEHWRGDRQSNGSPLDEADSTLAFEAFNVAFDGLVGRASQLSAADMTAFRKFAMALTYPPNPVRSSATRRARVTRPTARRSSRSRHRRRHGLQRLPHAERRQRVLRQQRTDRPSRARPST